MKRGETHVETKKECKFFNRLYIIWLFVIVMPFAIFAGMFPVGDNSKADSGSYDFADDPCIVYIDDDGSL